MKGLDVGADDYLTKPFHFEELVARIKALTRRKQAVLPGTVYSIADLQVDCFRKSVSRAGKPISLTAKEFTLLELLIYNKNRVLSRAYIAFPGQCLFLRLKHIRDAGKRIAPPLSI